MLRILRNLFARSPSPKVIEEREQLYELYFGASPKIYHSTNKIYPHIDVYHFEPSEGRPFHTLITGGMAGYRQSADEASVPRYLGVLGAAILAVFGRRRIRNRSHAIAESSESSRYGEQCP